MKWEKVSAHIHSKQEYIVIFIIIAYNMKDTTHGIQKTWGAFTGVHEQRSGTTASARSASRRHSISAQCRIQPTKVKPSYPSSLHTLVTYSKHFRKISSSFSISRVTKMQSQEKRLSLREKIASISRSRQFSKVSTTPKENDSPAVQESIAAKAKTPTNRVSLAPKVKDANKVEVKTPRPNAAIIPFTHRNRVSMTAPIANSLQSVVNQPSRGMFAVR